MSILPRWAGGSRLDVGRRRGAGDALRPRRGPVWVEVSGVSGADADAERVAAQDAVVVVELGHQSALGVVLGRGDHAGAGPGGSGDVGRGVDVAAGEGAPAAPERQSLVGRGEG